MLMCREIGAKRITIHLCGKVMFSYHGICLSVQAVTFEHLHLEASFLVVHLDYIQVKFDYLGHWVKVTW